MDVSIIIVNYNTMQLTKNCIKSVFEQTKGLLFEVIVVDNASCDGSLEMLINNKYIQLIKSNVNLGFGRANNLGIKNALGKYVFLLNSDTILIDNSVKILFDFAESHLELKIGTVGTLLIDKDGLINSPFSSLPSPFTFDGVLRRLRLTGNHSVQVLNKIEKNGFSKVGFVCGANMFIPASTIEDVGLFDPDYFMYCEETDLQKRMADSGYNRFVINNKGIIHLSGGSFKERKNSYERYELLQKSLLLYYRKHYTGLAYLFSRINILFIILRDLKNNYHTFNRKEIFSAIRLALLP